MKFLKVAIVVFVVLVIGFIGFWFFGGEAARPDLILMNDTGLTITEIQIVPSGKKDLVRFQSINLRDEQTYQVRLPQEFNDANTFRILVVSGDKTIESKGSITINRGGDTPPVFDMQIRKGFKVGKYVGGIGGAFVAVAGLDTVAQILKGNGTGVWRINQWLKRIGGSLPGGITVVAVIPVVIGTIGYIVGALLESEKLELTPVL
jgi:hypothetical protein